MDDRQRMPEWNETFVSTGRLPPDPQVAEYVSEAHTRFRDVTDGEVSAVYRALARMPADQFGVCVVDTVGDVFAAGDTDTRFTIMSVSKPFVFALVCDRLGPSGVRGKVGMNATGLAFNSLAGVERSADGRTNPMVNSGAIASTSLVPGSHEEERWSFILEGLSRFAGRELTVNEEVYASATETNFRNRGIVWRPAFGVLIVVSVVVLLLSLRLKPDKGRPDVGIDWVGVVLAATGIIFIAFGFNNLNGWGLGLAGANAPFSILGLSPAPVMIVVGVFLGQAFLSWTRRYVAAGGTALLPLQILDNASERAAVYAMFSVVALEAALNFTVPLYIQIVQGRSPFDTTIAMLPFNLTVFFAALLVVRYYPRFTPRQIGRFGFTVCTVALLWLVIVVRNDWSSVPVLVGLVAFGIGQGSLVTPVFNVLVTAAPKELAGDVGSLRGTTQNLASAVGTAVAGALLVTLLSTTVMRQLAANPILTPELQAQVNLDSITFVSDDRLTEVIMATDATPEQKAEALRVNSESRLWSFKVGLLLLAGVSLLSILPAGRLPVYLPAEMPE